MKKTLYVMFMLVVVMGAGCSADVGERDDLDRMSPLAHKARLKVDAGDVDAAIALYKKALDDNSQLGRVHLDLALLLHVQDGKKDYAGTIYHYQKYLELRPESEKRKMIENRIRLASQEYAGKILGRTYSGNQPIITELEDENKKLKAELALSQEKSRLLKKKILQRNDMALASDKKVMNESDRAGKRTYTVQPGDTLEKIAVFFYNDAGKAADISGNNKALIKDPNRLIAGQVLVIP
jgi:nucleoid-associated protein YgaU